MTPTRSLDDAGFTLVELVVVMAIIGITSAALVLTLPGSQSHVRHAAERVAAQAAAARDQAILTGQPASFTPAPPAGISISAEPAGPVSFDATGLATPARLTLSSGDAAATVTIDAVGGVRAN